MEITTTHEANHVKLCVICKIPLSGKQLRYCSRKCHNACGNAKHQNYIKQQERGLKRKIQLLNAWVVSALYVTTIRILQP